MKQTLLHIWLTELMRSAVLCFCNFSRQGQSLFNLLGKDKPVSRRSTKHFSLWCNLIPAALWLWLTRISSGSVLGWVWQNWVCVCVCVCNSVHMQTWEFYKFSSFRLCKFCKPPDTAAHKQALHRGTYALHQCAMLVQMCVKTFSTADAVLVIFHQQT